MKYSMEEANRALRENPLSYIEQHDKRVEEVLRGVAKEIEENVERHKIVMISGPSGSGKTTSALKIERWLREAGISANTISMDDFFLSNTESPRKADGSIDYETVHAIDLPLFERCMRGLAAGENTKMPRYDFHTGQCKQKVYDMKLEQNSIVVVEGIHALNDLVTSHLPQENLFKIYVSVSSDLCGKDGAALKKRQIRLMRRLVRDFRYRNASAELTFTMWQHVLIGELQYVLPNKSKADRTIDTMFPFEAAVLKRQAVPLLQDAARVEQFREDAEMVLRALRGVEEVDEALLPETSLLREFVGGSVYYNEGN